MGLKDFTSTVLTRYKADTSDHKRELKKLRGAERKAHKERLQELEDHNAKLDKQIETWGKVAAGIGVAVAAGAALHEGYQRLQERSRLMAATQGADLDRLKKATNGLVSETRLLEFASKAMNGTFKLSQGQMDQALKGALALRKTLGVDLSHALERVQQAITEGTTEPLKELGLVVKGVENDTREGLMATLDALQQQAREAGPDLSLPGDEMAASGVKMEDALNKLFIALGRVAQKLAPVIAAFAELASTIADISDFVGSDDQSRGGIVSDLQADITRLERDLSRRKGSYLAGEIQAELDLKRKQLRVAQSDLRSENRRKTQKDWERRLQNYGSSLFPEYTGSPGGSGSRKSGPGGYDISGSVVSASDRGNIRYGRAGTGGAGFKSLSEYGPEVEAAGRSISDAIGEVVFEVQGAEAFLQEKLEQQSILQRMFGPLSEFDAYATGFEMLTGAATSAFDAWITGAESVGTAFKRAIGESLRSLASQMLIESLKHTAYAIGSLAFGDLRGAGTHAIAAAKFGAGAAAAGIAARALGAGQSAGPASTAGTAGVGRGGTVDHRGGGLGQQTQVYILGDNFGGMSARERESRFRQMGRAAGMTFEGDVIQDG